MREDWRAKQTIHLYGQLPNVLVAPRLGGAARDVVRHQGEMMVERIEAWLRGERPRPIVNPTVLDR